MSGRDTHTNCPRKLLANEIRRQYVGQSSDREQNTSISNDIADIIVQSRPALGGKELQRLSGFNNGQSVSDSSSKIQRDYVGNGCDDDELNEIENGLDDMWGISGMQMKYDGMTYSQ